MRDSFCRRFSFLVIALFLISSFFHRVSFVSAAENLIQNPSVETVSPVSSQLPDMWSKYKTGSNRTTFTYPVIGQNSSKAVKVQFTRRSSGDAGWQFQEFPVVGGQSYTFSDSYTSNIKSYLIARFKLSNNTYSNQSIGGTFYSSSSWKLAQTTFVAPTNAVSVSIIHVIRAVGYLTTDNYSLVSNAPVPTSTPSPTPISTPTPTATPSPTPTPIPTTTPSPTVTPSPTPTPTSQNLITNPNLETVSSNINIPLGWKTDIWGAKTVSFVYPAIGVDNSRAVRVDVTKFTTGDAKWYFDDVPVVSGATYSFSDTYQSNVVGQLSLRYQKTDGTFLYLLLANLDPSLSWSTVTKNFTVPADVKSVTVFHTINSLGWLVTDNYFLSRSADALRFDQGVVSLNFDDGWLSAYENAIPVLSTAGFKSTHYLVSNYLGQSGYISQSQVLTLQSGGHEIGDHTRSHAHLPTLSSAQITDEIVGGRLDLINFGFSPVDTFAYPFGEYNTLTDTVIKSASLMGARTSDPGFNYKDSDKFFLKTKSVEATTTLAQVRSWIDTAIADKTWLILVFHEVDDTGSQYSVTPTNFQEIINYLVSTKVSVMTNKQVLSQMLP